MKTILFASFLLLQIPTQTLEIKPDDTQWSVSATIDQTRVVQEGYVVAEFLYPNYKAGIADQDDIYDTRCVVIYPRDKKSKLAWLIDRVENKASLVYVNYPWPQYCKEKAK